MINVRPATEQDEFAILQIMKSIGDNPIDAGFIEFFRGFNLKRSHRQLRESVGDKLAYVADDDGRIVGFAFMLEGDNGFGDQRALYEKLIYTLPEARRSHVGNDLIDAIIEKSLERKLPLFFTNSNKDRPEIKDRLLKRKGFVTIATVYGINLMESV